MLKKLLTLLMVGAVTVASSSTLVSCNSDIKMTTVDEAQYHVLSTGNANATFVQVGTSAIVLDCGRGLPIEQSGESFIDGSNELIENYAVDESFMSNYMKSVGIETIESVFISHIHSDHYNLIGNLSENFTINNVVSPINTSGFDSRIKSKLSDDTNIIYNFNASYKFLGITFKNLSYKSQDLMNETTSENDKSTVLEFKLGTKTFLFTGDAEPELAYDIAKKFTIETVDFFLVPHHGSGNSGTIAFFNKYKMKPKYCVISGTGVGGSLDEVSGNHKFPGETTIVKMRDNCEENYITGYLSQDLIDTFGSDVFNDTEKSYRIDVNTDIFTLTPVSQTIITASWINSTLFLCFFVEKY